MYGYPWFVTESDWLPGGAERFFQFGYLYLPGRYVDTIDSGGTVRVRTLSPLS